MCDKNNKYEYILCIILSSIFAIGIVLLVVRVSWGAPWDTCSSTTVSICDNYGYICNDIGRETITVGNCTDANTDANPKPLISEASMTFLCPEGFILHADISDFKTGLLALLVCKPE